MGSPSTASRWRSVAGAGVVEGELRRGAHGCPMYDTDLVMGDLVCQDEIYRT